MFHNNHDRVGSVQVRLWHPRAWEVNTQLKECLHVILKVCCICNTPSLAVRSIVGILPRHTTRAFWPVTVPFWTSAAVGDKKLYEQKTTFTVIPSPLLDKCFGHKIQALCTRNSLKWTFTVPMPTLANRFQCKVSI